MTEQSPPAPSQVLLKLTVRDFLMLDEAGAFSGFKKTELLDGSVFGVNAQHRPHLYAKSELAFRLRDALKNVDPDLAVLVDGTVGMAPHSAPEPDIVVTSEPRGPGIVPVATVALLVEVAASSHAIDAGLKARIYAAASVPEYWLVDLVKQKIQRMSAPDAGRYTAVDTFPLGDPLASATIPGLVVATAGLA